MQKNMRILIMLLAALLLSGCLAAAETKEVPQAEISLPVGMRFYPKASFTAMASYRVLAHPDGADLSHGWSWLRLDAEGAYRLAGFDAEGSACLDLTIHAVQDAPALLDVTMDEACLPAGLSLHFASEAPYSFSVTADPAADVYVEDAGGALLGMNGAQIHVSDEAVPLLLCVELDGQSHRIPALVSLAYSCTACGESPLCKGDHSACTAAPEPTPEPTAEPEASPAPIE